MYLDVYVGRVEEGQFDGLGGEIGNLPVRRSPFFPGSHTHFYRLVRKIDRGEMTGRQTDWGGWVAVVRKHEIEAFIEECYGDDETYQERSESLGHLYDELQELRVYVASLDEDKWHALVASEL